VLCFMIAEPQVTGRAIAAMRPLASGCHGEQRQSELVGGDTGGGHGAALSFCLLISAASTAWAQTLCAGRRASSSINAGRPQWRHVACLPPFQWVPPFQSSTMPFRQSRVILVMATRRGAPPQSRTG
jgi:hypothetical protein